MSKNYLKSYYHFWDFGYPNIISEAGAVPDWNISYSEIDKKYYFDNALVFETALYELTDSQYDEFLEVFGKDGFVREDGMFFRYNNRYFFRTYADSPEALEKFSENAAYTSPVNWKMYREAYYY